MAMVGGIYGSRGDDSFVISDYGVPTQVIVLVFRVSTGRRWFSHWIFGYSLFSGRNSFWKQASRSDVKAPKKNVSFLASGFELEARVVLCIYGVVLDFQRRLPTRVVSSEDRCGRLVHPVLTTGLYDSAETKNVKNEEDAEVAEAVDAEPVSEYEIEEASIYKDEAEVSSYDEEQDEDEENMRMWL
ncbi:hypothetical protein U1Q18_014474 [Sarracenia purpurea var. burkii]